MKGIRRYCMMDLRLWIPVHAELQKPTANSKRSRSLPWHFASNIESAHSVPQLAVYNYVQTFNATLSKSIHFQVSPFPRPDAAPGMRIEREDDVKDQNSSSSSPLLTAHTKSSPSLPVSSRRVFCSPLSFSRPSIHLLSFPSPQATSVWSTLTLPTVAETFGAVLPI